MPKRSLFGFWQMFGNLFVRVLADVRVLGRSVCSVDLVEKLCKSLWVNLWEMSGKGWAELWKASFYTYLEMNLHIFWKNVESFTKGFTQRFFPINVEFYTFSTESITTTTNILEERS